MNSILFGGEVRQVVESNQISKETFLILALKAHRANFVRYLTEASQSEDSAVLATLRLDTTYELAEFYYLLELLGMKEPGDTSSFDDYVNRHNHSITELMADKPKMRRLGLREDRLKQALFDDQTRPRLMDVWRQMPGTIEQSNLARFLAPVMSTETVRKLVVDGEKAGFLVRQRSVYGAVLVRSNGTLETIYSKALRELQDKLTNEIADTVTE